MKKPYMKKITQLGGYTFWYVNGFYIRNHLDPEFGNIGHHNHFKFIPKNEMWIDYENGKKEAKYYIDNFLRTQREVKKGKPYSRAWRIANKMEKTERGKSKFLERIRKIKVKEKILGKIRKKRLFSKYTENLKIWLVRGDLVRSLFFVDFAQGGHYFVYKFVPQEEVWIDDDLYYKEIPYVLIHELHERYLMSKGWPYDPGGVGIFTRKGDIKGRSAHFNAEDVESKCRKNPRLIRRTLIKEINKNESIPLIDKK